MKKYYRIMLGRQSAFAKEAREGNFIGIGWLEDINLENKLPENSRNFNQEFIPIFLEKYPDRTRVAAGLACGMTHTVAKGIKQGDIVLSPDGIGNYYIGEIAGDYFYQKNANLPHRRKVNWYEKIIPREAMSEALKNTSGSIATVANVSQYSDEIEKFISGDKPPVILTTDETIEDPSVFALEKHLEDFLIQNWKHTELGKHYNIYEEDGEQIGRQYPADSDYIDILAISKDKKELLVIELKKGRASYAVVGQIQNYMGYVKHELAEEGQEVRGVIIALEEDIRLTRALSVTSDIDFYTYKIHFELEKK